VIGHPVAADLDHQPRRQREGPAPGLAVTQHEPGEHHRAVRAGGAGERAPVPGQQRRGQHRDVLADHPHVHPPVGQVAPVDLDRQPAAADPLQRGHQHVEAVDDLVPVGQERPRRSPAVRTAQAADQEPAVIALQPAIHVRVVQGRPLLAQPPQVRGGDAELLGDALIADLGRQVGPGRHRHPVRPEHRGAATDHELRAGRADRPGRGHDVGFPGLLVAQQRRQVRQRRVPDAGGHRGSINSHEHVLSPQARSGPAGWQGASR
jgi:hypothetical protein